MDRVWGLFCPSVTSRVEEGKCQRCTGCHRLPPLLHPQPLCCHLLTRGRLRRTLPLAGWTCCAASRPMRREVRAAGGECASRATSEQQRRRLEVVSARWPDTAFSLEEKVRCRDSHLYRSGVVNAPFNPFIHSISL